MSGPGSVQKALIITVKQNFSLKKNKAELKQ